MTAKFRGVLSSAKHNRHNYRYTTVVSFYLPFSLSTDERRTN